MCGATQLAERAKHLRAFSSGKGLLLLLGNPITHPVHMRSSSSSSSCQQPRRSLPAGNPSRSAKQQLISRSMFVPARTHAAADEAGQSVRHWLNKWKQRWQQWKLLFLYLSKAFFFPIKLTWLIYVLPDKKAIFTQFYFPLLNNFFVLLPRASFRLEIRPC